MVEILLAPCIIALAHGCLHSAPSESFSSCCLLVSRLPDSTYFLSLIPHPIAFVIAGLGDLLAITASSALAR